MFCSKPFEWLEITPNGTAYVCCPSWLSKPIGNINEKNTLEIWNSEAAKDIRTSILDGSFKYCNNCPYLHNKNGPVCDQPSDHYFIDIVQNKRTIIDNPRWLNLAYDQSCNLACPSCRTEFIQIHDKKYDDTKKLQDRLLEELKNKLEWLYITGSGDPFGSRLFRELLCSMKEIDYPNINLYLHTNAIMLNEGMWDKMAGIRNAVKWIHVSIDAATDKTYAVNRKGGKWDKLQSNLKFISQLRINGPVNKFEISFVVQQNNWREMEAFVDIGKSLKVDRIMFNPIDNWRNDSAFLEKAVHLPTHIEYDQFVKHLGKSVFYDDVVDMGVLTKLRKIFLL